MTHIIRNNRHILGLNSPKLVQILPAFAISAGIILSSTTSFAQNATLGGGFVPIGAGVSGPGSYSSGANNAVKTVSPIGSTVGGSSQTTSLGNTGGWSVEITPFIEQRITYSDNIDLAPDGQEEDDFVSTTSAGVNATVNLRRFQGYAGYTVSYDKYFESDNDDNFRHNANLNGTAEIIPNLFYVDAQGSVTDSVLSSNGAFSGNPTAAPGDRSTTYQGAISPSLRSNIGGWANAEVRYTFQGAIYEDVNGTDNPDEHTHTYTAALVSDPRKFGTIGWDIRGEYENYNSDDELRDQDRLSGSVGLQYALSPKVTLNGNAGYDEYDPELVFDGNDATGAFGNVGFVYRPNSRTQGNAYVGYRYGGLDYGAALNYQLAERLAFSATAGRAIQSGSFQNRTVIAGADGTLVDPLTNQVLSPEDLQASLRTSQSLTDNLNLTLSGNTGKTSYTITGTAQNRQYEDDVQGDELVLGLSGAMEYQLNRGLSIGADAAYSTFTSDDDTEIDNDTLILGIGAKYKFTRIFEAFARYSYSQRFADNPLGPNEASEYTENAGYIGLRASF